MKHNYLVVIALSIVFLCGTSCRKDQNIITQPSPYLNADIYICGTYVSPNGHSNAAYWKNGQLHPVGDLALSDLPVSSCAFSIELAQDKVYTVGYNDQNLPCLWINENAIELSDPYIYSGYASSIKIQNDTLFISGNITTNGTYNENAVFWTTDLNGDNKELHILETEDSRAGELYLNGNLVYIAGQKGFNPCYWVVSSSATNRHDLSDQNGTATKIRLHNGQPYVLGYLTNVDSINDYGVWTNDAFNSLAIAGNIANVTDFEFNNEAELFYTGYKDEQNTSFMNIWNHQGNTYQKSILKDTYGFNLFISGNDFYVVGNDKLDACFWKNNTIYHLTPNSNGYDIVVNPK